MRNPTDLSADIISIVCNEQNKISQIT